MRTMVVCDDYYHPAQTPRSGLQPLAERGWEFDWIEDTGDWSTERMNQCSAVILTKTNEVSAINRQPWMTDAVQAAFREYVRRGNGLLVIHSGSAGYEDGSAIRAITGGAFVKHPPQCAVSVEPYPEHILTVGCTPFTLVDEHYCMTLDDPQANIFVSTTSEHGTQPGGWTRCEGEGRVCVLTPGHNLDVWLHPSYQILIENALRWCHRSDL